MQVCPVSFVAVVVYIRVPIALIMVWRCTDEFSKLHSGFARATCVPGVVRGVCSKTLGYPQAIRCDCVDTKLCRVDLHAAVPNVVRGRTPSL